MLIIKINRYFSRKIGNFQMAVKNSTRRIKLFENYIIMSRLYTFMKVIDENLNTIVLTISKNRLGFRIFRVIKYGPLKRCATLAVLPLARRRMFGCCVARYGNYRMTISYVRRHCVHCCRAYHNSCVTNNDLRAQRRSQWRLTVQQYYIHKSG